MSNNLDLLFSIEMINVHPNYETINDMKKKWVSLTDNYGTLIYLNVTR